MNMLRAPCLLLTFVILAGMGFDPIDYQIGPLLIGQHIDSALTFLGKPIRIERFLLEHRSGGREFIDSVWVDIPVDTNIVYTFDSLEICTELDGSIRSIDLSTRRFATHRELGSVTVRMQSSNIMANHGAILTALASTPPSQQMSGHTEKGTPPWALFSTL